MIKALLKKVIVPMKMPLETAGMKFTDPYSY